MKNRRWAGKRSGIAFGAVAIILTALVVPYACAGTTGAVPFSGDNPSSGTRTVTIADITDFHGHIERGADNATAFTVADSHNPGNMIPVSTGDLVGGSPYESAVEKDQPTLDMAKAWGLAISAVGNHEFDRGVADFNNRIADPSNGIDWLCANTSAANKSSDGLLSHVRDSTIRTVNGKRIGFVGALTDALGSVATPQITRDADLDERAVDAINRVARELKRSGKGMRWWPCCTPMLQPPPILGEMLMWYTPATVTRSSVVRPRVARLFTRRAASGGTWPCRI